MNPYLFLCLPLMLGTFVVTGVTLVVGWAVWRVVRPPACPPITAKHRLRLRDGRFLAYEVRGADQGRPVFYLHGVPGSRLHTHGFTDALLEEYNIRLVTFDRPGCGQSDPHPGRTFRDHAKDLLALARALDIERFYVIGFSMGGAFAWSVAHYLADRLEGVALLAPLGPPESGGYDSPKATPANRWGYRIGRASPRLLRILMRIIGPPSHDSFEEYLVPMFSEPDRRKCMEPTARMMLREESEEFYRADVEGHLEDALLAIIPWEFDVKDIRAQPIYVWVGTDDALVPAEFNLYMKKQLSPDNVHFHFKENSGHFWWCYEEDAIREILGTLLEPAVHKHSNLT